MKKIRLPRCTINSTDAKILEIRTKLQELLERARVSAGATIPTVDARTAVSSIFARLVDFLGLTTPTRMDLEELEIDTSDEAFELYKRLEAELNDILGDMGLLCDSTEIKTSLAFIRMILLRLFAQAADTRVEALIANKDLEIFDLMIDFIGYLNRGGYTIYDAGILSVTRNTALLGWTHSSLPGLIHELRLIIIKYATLSKHKTVIRELANALRLLGSYAKACVLVSANPASNFTRGELNPDQLDYHYDQLLTVLRAGEVEKTLTVIDLYKLIDPAVLDAAGSAATDRVAVAVPSIAAVSMESEDLKAGIIESMRIILHTEFNKDSSTTKDLLVRLSKLDSSYRRLFVLAYLFCYKLEHFADLVSALEDLIDMSGGLLFSHYSFCAQGMNSVIFLLEAHCRLIMYELSILHAHAPITTAVSTLYKTLLPLEIAVKRLADIPADLEILGTAEHRELMKAEQLRALQRFAILARPYGLITPFFSKLQEDEELNPLRRLAEAAPAVGGAGAAAGAGAVVDEGILRLSTDEIRRKRHQIDEYELKAKGPKEGNRSPYAFEAYNACKLLAQNGDRGAYKRLLSFRSRGFGVEVNPEEQRRAGVELDWLNGISAAGAGAGSAVAVLEIAEAAAAAAAAASALSAVGAASLVTPIRGVTATTRKPITTVAGFFGALIGSPVVAAPAPALEAAGAGAGSMTSIAADAATPTSVAAPAPGGAS